MDCNDDDENKKITKHAAGVLLRLADFLENDVTGSEFDIRSWIFSINSAKEGCGTVACACGWAAISQKFRGLVVDGGDKVKCTRTKSTGVKAASDYFKITKSQAKYLFFSANYPADRRGRMCVVKRIRKFAQDKSVPDRTFICG